MLADESSVSPDDWSLQRRCEFIATVQGAWVGGINLVAFQTQTDGTFMQWRYTLLHNHQRGYFLEGLKKLGIDYEKEPPAVVAAKYHFFSNELGGVEVEMVVESPKKAWVRYICPPQGSGVAYLAIPPCAGRATFAGWHAHNGVRLNAPRLGFVLSKGFTEGEPWTEGYFREYDHDLTEEERLQFDSNATMPEFDRETGPKLDRELWPPDRRSKALRNFVRGYVEESVVSLLQVLGTPTTAQIVRQAYEGIAIQYGNQFLKTVGIEARNAGALATFMKYIGDMAGDTVEHISPSPDKHILRTTSRRLFREEKVPPEIHRAMFAFVEMMPRIMGRRMKVSLTSLIDEGAPYDEMVLEDITA